jgi:hypothetical protein
MRNKLIGKFALDIQDVYNQKSHRYVERWVGLSDPSDTEGSVRGFLKVRAFGVVAMACGLKGAAPAVPWPAVQFSSPVVVCAGIDLCEGAGRHQDSCIIRCGRR